MSFTADITTDIGKVRYLIGDTDRQPLRTSRTKLLLAS
jgi:hypothetical protein